MKRIVPTLKLNQKVWAIIEEVIAQNVLIVSFQGDLIRVENQSGRRFRPGQRIQLKVSAVEPLGFQLIESRPILERKLDITI